MLTLLGFANPFAPAMNVIVTALHALLDGIDHFVGNYGWSLVILAVLVKAAFWPLNATSFKSMSKMQTLQPKVKALQKKYPNKDPESAQKMNAEMMALYKEHGVNPAAGCVPILLQMPILFGLYAAITSDSAKFVESSWLWIGSGLSKAYPHIFATSLVKTDYLLLGLYMISMYFSVRFSSPATTPEQAQQQKIMAFISPAMIGYFSYRAQWPSALLIYWLTFNVVTMAQQWYLLRDKRREAAVAKASAAPAPVELEPLPADGTLKTDERALGTATNGRPNSRRRRRSRR